MLPRHIFLNARLGQQIVQSMKMYNKAVPVLGAVDDTPISKRKASEELLTLALKETSVGFQDWDNVKQFILSHNSNKSITSTNIDGMIMATMSNLNRQLQICFRLDLAKSYFKYLEAKNIKPNLATVGRYLKLLYNSCRDKITKAQEKEILDLCDDIQRSNPILDSRTLDSILLALSLTKDWKKCIGIIHEIKRTSSVSIAAYSALAASAFLHKEEELAWNLLHEIIALDKPILSDAYLGYLKSFKNLRKQETIIERLENLFMFLKETEVLCKEDIVDYISQHFNLGQKTITKASALCKNCKTNLEKLELTDDEFAELKAVFLKNAIVGKDIFIKSNPGEMKQFEEFVSSMGSYDVVLDGLNIAYSSGIKKGPHVFSTILANVISHFVQQKKSVLLLGRVHMTRWPKRQWDYIKQNASMFLTQNISQDDPYLLYCALHSGKDTIIVTRDLMRGHKFLLKDRKYKVLFNRWLLQRQYILLNAMESNKVFFSTPPRFSAVAQKNGNKWHIPYIPKADESTINETYHKTWFCLECK